VGRVQGASLRALVALSPHAKRDARFVYLIIPQETDIDRFYDALQWAIASLYQPPSFLRGETWNHSSMMYDPCSPVSGTSSRRATPRNASQSFEAVAVGRCCCCCSPLLLLYISHYFQTLHNQLSLDTRETFAAHELHTTVAVAVTVSAGPKSRILLMNARRKMHP
jgi:hypothetical protein